MSNIIKTIKISDTYKRISQVPDGHIRMTYYASVMVLLILLSLIILMSTPIADDYARLTFIPREGFWGYLSFSYKVIDGRYSNALIMDVVISLFGAAGMKWAILTYLAALITGLYTLLRQCITASRIKLFVSAAALSSFAIILMPSVFDLLGWFNSSSIYIAGLASATGFTSYALWTLRHWHTFKYRSRITHAAVLLASSLLTQGFVEPLSAAMIVFAVLVSISALIHKKRQLYVPMLIILTGLVAGIAAVYFAPGTQLRSHIQDTSSSSIYSSVVDAIPNIRYISEAMLSWLSIIIITIAIIIADLLPQKLSIKRSLLWALTIGLVPLALTALIASYAHSNEGGRAAFRTISVGLVPFYLSLGFIIAVAISNYFRRINISSVYSYGLSILSLASLIVIAPSIITIIHAENLRSSAVEYRDNSVQTQLMNNDKSTSLTPAPILLTNSQAADLNYLSQEDQLAGWAPLTIARYYHVENSFSIDTHQPATYCMSHITISWESVQSCDQLASKNYH